MIVSATTTLPVAWLVARAAGLVAFALLTAAVTLGLLLSTRILGNRRGKLLMEWHQALIWTCVSMLGLHGAALLLDPTLKFGPLSVLVPGMAPWRPLPVAAGIVAGWLILTLAVSFRFRRRIGQRRWRLLHYASFVAFSAGLWHALNTGSDLVGTRGLLFALGSPHPGAVAHLRAHPHSTSAGSAGPRSQGHPGSCVSDRCDHRLEPSWRAGVSVTARWLESVSFRAMGTDCTVSVTAHRGRRGATHAGQLPPA